MDKKADYFTNIKEKFIEKYKIFDNSKKDTRILVIIIFLIIS